MTRTLYGVLEDTLAAAAELRQVPALDPGLEERLSRLEAAIQRALASSPDGATVARAEEYVALNALCDLHLAIQDRPESLRSRFRPIIDEWIAYAAETGLTPQELDRAEPAAREVDEWLRTLD